MDWDDLRVFLQVTRSGQMAGAARHLGLDHSTVSRRIARLEQQLGASCFDRAGRRLKITERGTKLLAAVEAMESVVVRDIADRAGEGLDVAGSVRVGTTEGFGASYLAQRLSRITDNHPGLSIELVAMPRTFSLASREVDLAIGMDRISTGNLRIRKLTDFGLGLYAAPTYLADRGRPKQASDLPHHEWCGYIEELRFTDELDLLRFEAVEIEPRFRTTSVTVQLEAVASGAMIGMLPTYIARQRPGLERLLPSTVSMQRAYWLTVHEDLADVPRVRNVAQAIEAMVRSDRNLFA